MLDVRGLAMGDECCVVAQVTRFTSLSSESAGGPDFAGDVIELHDRSRDAGDRLGRPAMSHNCFGKCKSRILIE